MLGRDVFGGVLHAFEHTPCYVLMIIQVEIANIHLEIHLFSLILEHRDI